MTTPARGAATGDRVAVVLATYDPPASFLERQLASLREQTHANWYCVISDDASPADSFDRLRTAVGDDPRFLLVRHDQRFGFYANFERGLGLVDAATTDFVALCDQDDWWSSDKLSELLSAFSSGTTLAYGDVRVVDTSGQVLSPTYWRGRRNNWTDLTDSVLANTITGAAAVWRAELLADVLPFPVPTEASFHDHWIAVLALARGRIAYVPRPLQDYVQHGGNVVGHSSRTSGGAGSTPRSRRAALSPRRHWQRWQTAYDDDLVRIMGIAQLASERGRPQDSGRRRQLERLARLDRGPGTLLWMAWRALRTVAGDDAVTLGVEKRLLAAMVWVRLRRLGTVAPSAGPGSPPRALLAFRPTSTRSGELVRRLLGRLLFALQILVAQGPGALMRRFRQRDRDLPLVGRQAIRMSVRNDDLLAADWSSPRRPPARQPRSGGGPLVINWVLPRVAVGSGGHVTILRFVEHLEAVGHHCRLYFYDAMNPVNLPDQRAILKHFPPVNAEVYGDPSNMLPADAVIATSWQTAYPVFNSDLPAERFYFVQDFEPDFYPVSSESVLAENTYRFGLRGITAGRYLAERLQRDYGMRCDWFDFGSDPDHYRFSNSAPRRKVLFYARPVTPRRGFELGVLALQKFAEMHPDYEINFVGWDTSGYDVPFRHLNHGVLDKVRLNALYNECAAGLVIPLTNMSLLPLELLAAGCFPVVNDAESNRKVSDNEHIVYAAPSPVALAEAMSAVVSRDGLVDDAKRAAESVEQLHWSRAFKQFDAAVVTPLLT